MMVSAAHDRRSKAWDSMFVQKNRYMFVRDLPL